MKYGVLAGDYRQYQHWLKENKDIPSLRYDSFYIKGLDSVRGIVNLQLVYYGTFYKNYSSRELEEIENYVATHQTNKPK